MSESGCGDASLVQGTADELFQLAALFMGDPAAAVSLVEETLAAIQIDPCLNPEAARALSTKALAANALIRLQGAAPGTFLHAPEPDSAGTHCVDPVDQGPSGPSPEQLRGWLSGRGREDLRGWLSALSGRDRFIFVQHAVLGFGNAAIAASLPAASPAWTPEGVGQVYRSALCSLANSLAHSPGAAQTPAMAGAAR